MIEVMPAPVRETNERGEWLGQTREQFRALVESLGAQADGRAMSGFMGSLVKHWPRPNESLPKRRLTTLCVESGGKVSKGARAVHIRLKALKRERSRHRYPTLTLDLTGIL